MTNRNQYGPYTARPGKRGAPWLLYLVCTAAFLAIALGIFYALAPESLARLHGRFFGGELQISGLTLDVDRRFAEIAPGGFIEIHPLQAFRLGHLSTNRWRNYDLRLYSPDFDISRVEGASSAAPRELMSEEALEAGLSLRLEVREGAGEKALAVFEVRPVYTAVDLAALGDAASDPARKADLYQRAFKLDSASAALREKLEKALVEAGRLAEALLMYEEDLSKNGPGRELLERILRLCSELGEDEKSVKALTGLIDLARRENRDAAPYRRQLAELYIKLKDLDKAEAMYEEMLGAAEGGARAGLLGDLRNLYRELGRPEQEIAALKRLLEVTPDERAPVVWTDLIALYERLADAEGQAESWLALAGILPDGDSKANAYKRAAFILAGAEKFGEAARAYQTALALDPDDINVYLNLARLALAQNDDDINVYLNLARLALAQNDREAYRANLLKALELAPERRDLRLELAGAMHDDGLKAEAVQEYDALLTQNPLDQDIRLRLIAILEEMGGEDARLREEYAKITAAQADNKVAAYNLAVLDFRGGKWDEAIKSLKLVLTLDPDDLDARSYLFSAYEKKGDTENMLQEAGEIYRRDQRRRDFRELLINSYENAGDYTKLLALAGEFVRLAPGDIENWRLMSSAQARLNNPVEAARALYKGAAAVGGNIEHWLAAAAALSFQNQWGEARAAYQKVLELEPENNRAAEGLLDISLREVSGVQ